MTDEVDISRAQTSYKPPDISPLTDCIMHRYVFRKDLPGLLGAYNDMRVNHSTIEISRNWKLDQIQRLISPDQHNTAHHSRRSIVSMLATAREVLSLHGTDHNLLRRERTAEQFIHSIGRSCR